MADKSTKQSPAKTQDTPETQDISKKQDRSKKQDTSRTQDTSSHEGQDNATKKGGEDQSPLDERVEQIDKNETYEDVIGRHEPSDRYPNQRR